MKALIMMFSTPLYLRYSEYQSSVVVVVMLKLVFEGWLALFVFAKPFLIIKDPFVNLAPAKARQSLRLVLDFFGDSATALQIETSEQVHQKRPLLDTFALLGVQTLLFLPRAFFRILTVFGFFVPIGLFIHANLDLLGNSHGVLIGL